MHKRSFGSMDRNFGLVPVRWVSKWSEPLPSRPPSCLLVFSVWVRLPSRFAISIFQGPSDIGAISPFHTCTYNDFPHISGDRIKKPKKKTPIFTFFIKKIFKLGHISKEKL